MSSTFIDSVSLFSATAEAENLTMPGTHGAVALTLASSAGGTILTRQYSRAPLQVQGVLHGGGELAEVALLNVAGGIVAGDVLDVDIALEERARARLRTIGATRVYRAEGGAIARTNMAISVADGAWVEYLPDETIPYAGAMYESSTVIDLAGGACALVTEVIGPGRLHRGERFAYRRLVSALRARRDGRPLVTDRLALEPSRWPPSLGPILGGYTHLATLYALGPGADDDLAGRLHALLARSGIHGSATLAGDGAVMLRALGHSAYALNRAVTDAAACCRAVLSGSAGWQ